MGTTENSKSKWEWKLVSLWLSAQMLETFQLSKATFQDTANIKHWQNMKSDNISFKLSHCPLAIYISIRN